MKNEKLRLFGLSIVLLLLGFVIFSNKSSAAATDVPVTLAVTAGSLNCYNTTGMGALGTIASSFTTGTLVGTAATNSWYCTDMAGNAVRSAYSGLSVQMSTNLSGPNGAFIATANVRIIAANPTPISGNVSCTATSDVTTLTSLTASPKYIIKKTGVAGAVCTLATTPSIQVTIPASQSVGSYSGTITVTNPQL